MFDRGGHDGLVDHRPGPQRRPADAQSALHDGEEVDLGSGAPATDTDDGDSSREGHGTEHTGHAGRADSSRTTSKGPMPRASSGSAALAPKEATASRNDACRTEATQRAPVAAASCTPAFPTPPAAPVTSTRSPRARPHWVNSASWAVENASGNPPASGQLTSRGTGMATRSSTTASSACAPPPTTAMTRSPIENRVVCRPVATTSPASSIPGMSGGDPAVPGRARSAA